LRVHQGAENGASTRAPFSAYVRDLLHGKEADMVAVEVSLKDGSVVREMRIDRVPNYECAVSEARGVAIGVAFERHTALDRAEAEYARWANEQEERRREECGE